MAAGLLISSLRNPATPATNGIVIPATASKAMDCINHFGESGLSSISQLFSFFCFPYPLFLASFFSSRLILEPPSLPEIELTYWARLSQKLEMVLEGSLPNWSQGPDPQRLKLFCQSIDLLRAQVELEGLRL